MSDEGGLVITGSRTGTGETGRLRIDPKPLVADEIEAEQDALQIRVRKTHLPFRDWSLPSFRGDKTRLATVANHPFLNCGTDVSIGLQGVHCD